MTTFSWLCYLKHFGCGLFKWLSHFVVSVQCSGQMGGLLYGIYFPVCMLYVLNFELLINDNTQTFSVTVRRSVVHTTDEGDLYLEGSVANGVDCGRSLVA